MTSPYPLYISVPCILSGDFMPPVKKDLLFPNFMGYSNIIDIIKREEQEFNVSITLPETSIKALKERDLVLFN